MNLNSIYWIKKEIEQIQNQINELTVIKTSSLSSMPSGSGGDSQVEKFIIRLEGLQEKLIKKLKKYIAERERIEKFIDAIEDDEVRVIARMRFIDNLGYQEIGDKLYIDQTTARKKLKRYLDKRGGDDNGKG